MLLITGHYAGGKKTKRPKISSEKGEEATLTGDQDDFPDSIVTIDTDLAVPKGDALRAPGSPQVLQAAKEQPSKKAKTKRVS